MEKLPQKLAYRRGEALDLTGGKISLYYDNGVTESRDLAESMVSGYDASKIGVQTLTVTYGNGSAIFNVTVSDKTLKEIRLSKSPDKLSYSLGEELDVAGGELTLVYSDRTEEGPIELTNAMVSGYDASKAGEQTLTVAYDNLTTTYEVTVSASETHESSDYALTVNSDGSYSVTVNDDSIPSGILVIAKYNADGRMVAIRSIPIQLTKGAQSGVLEDLKDADANYTVSLLSISYISLCDRVEVINVTPN